MSVATLDFESLKLIQSTAVDAAKTDVRPLPNDPEKTLLIAGGQHTIIETPLVPPPRNHVVETLADLAAAYARWSPDGYEATSEIAELPADEEGEAGTQGAVIRLPNIWIDLQNWQVLFFTDEPLRRSWVKLTLTPTPQWGLLRKLDNGVKLDQKGMVRLLRHDLAGCIDANLLPVFRSIDFAKNQNARAQREHGRDSLDADLQVSLTSAKGPIPEQILITAPVFAMRELDDVVARVVVTVDIDTDDRSFHLQILPGLLPLELEKARHELGEELAAKLQQELEDDELPVLLCGTPGSAVSRG